MGPEFTAQEQPDVGQWAEQSAAVLNYFWPALSLSVELTAPRSTTAPTAALPEDPGTHASMIPDLCHRQRSIIVY